MSSKKLSTKKVAIAIFAILLFMNISLSFTKDDSNANISLFGFDITFVKETKALPSTLCLNWDDCCILLDETLCFYRGNGR